MEKIDKWVKWFIGITIFTAAGLVVGHPTTKNAILKHLGSMKPINRPIQPIGLPTLPLIEEIENCSLLPLNKDTPVVTYYPESKAKYDKHGRIRFDTFPSSNSQNGDKDLQKITPKTSSSSRLQWGKKDRQTGGPKRQ